MPNKSSKKVKLAIVTTIIVLALIFATFIAITIGMLKGVVSEKHLLYAILTVLVCMFVLNIYNTIKLYTLLSEEIQGDVNAED